MSWSLWQTSKILIFLQHIATCLPQAPGSITPPEHVVLYRQRTNKVSATSGNSGESSNKYVSTFTSIPGSCRY